MPQELAHVVRRHGGADGVPAPAENDEDCDPAGKGCPSQTAKSRRMQGERAEGQRSKRDGNRALRQCRQGKENKRRPRGGTPARRREEPGTAPEQRGAQQEGERHVDHDEAPEPDVDARRRQDESGHHARGAAEEDASPPGRRDHAEAGRDRRRKSRCPLVDAEGAHRRRGEPVEEHRLVAIGREVERRREPVAADEHLARHLCMAPFVGIEERRRAETDEEHGEAGEGDQQRAGDWMEQRLQHGRLRRFRRRFENGCCIRVRRRCAVRLPTRRSGRSCYHTTTSALSILFSRALRVARLLAVAAAGR